MKPSKDLPSTNLDVKKLIVLGYVSDAACAGDRGAAIAIAAMVATAITRNPDFAPNIWNLSQLCDLSAKTRSLGLIDSDRRPRRYSWSQLQRLGRHSDCRLNKSIGSRLRVSARFSLASPARCKRCSFLNTLQVYWPSIPGPVKSGLLADCCHLITFCE